MIGRTPHEKPRTGARARADIPPEVLDQLYRGQIQTATLSETLAIDFARLIRETLPRCDASLSRTMLAQGGLGIVQRMELGGVLLLDGGNPYPLEELLSHSSDLIRGWCAYALAMRAEPKGVVHACEQLKPLAADPHFGVREWAWMAVRQQVMDQLPEALDHLARWTTHGDPGIRRFASEVTRPRGVWCPMIRALTETPEAGLGILEPLRSDPAEYVRLSVANWINDASKTRPDWAREITTRWLHESPTRETELIVKRALRTLTKKDSKTVETIPKSPAKPRKNPS